MTAPIYCRKPLSARKIMTLLVNEVPTNSVPAVAVIRGERVLFVRTGRKGRVDGISSFKSNLMA